MHISGSKWFRFNGKTGLTLFEMIIVLTVTLILSLLFIYSTKHVVVRTKVERVKEEHRVLSRALQNYRMDYNDYPIQLGSLNAPTAYISTLPNDPFIRQRENYIYYYQPSKSYKYIIISVGPDGDSDLEAMIYQFSQMTSSSSNEDESNIEEMRDDLISELLPVYLITKAYDPTNGIVSDGDVITFSHQ